MKHLFKLLLIFFGFVPVTFSQTVDSIKVEQAGELIKIHYKILNSNQYQTFNVAVSAKINGGLESKLESLIGDVGDAVKGGKDNYIVIWDVLKDVEEVNSVDFSVRAELLRDETPSSELKLQVKWENKKFYVLPSFSGGDGGTFYGIRLAYMGKWGVTGKYLIGKLAGDYDDQPSFSTGLALTKRILSKNGFQWHLTGGMEYAKMVFENSGNSGVYYKNLATIEIGTALAIRNFGFSFAYSHYNPSAESGYEINSKDWFYGCIGIRF